MASADSIQEIQEDKVFQKFRDKNKNDLPTVQAHKPRGEGEYVVYWKDIKRAFPDIDHLQKFLSQRDDTLSRGVRVSFQTENIVNLCTPVRVRFSSDPYTVIMREDFLEDTGERMDIEKVRSNGRMFQEVLQLQAWARSMKTADYDAILQSIPQQYHYLMEINDRYASTVFSDSPEDRALQTGETSAQFDVDRIYNLREPLWCLDFAAPRLFMVLPADLCSWNAENSMTHTFRLYFLCDFKYRSELDHHTRVFMSRSKIQPKHIHLSGHPGYDLLRSHEFFNKFGHFALEILKIIRDGYLDEDCDIPALSTFGILKHCDGTSVQHLLNQENIGPLVDKSIAYIQQQHSASGRHSQPRLWMNGPETRQIQSYLKLPEGDNGVGDLFQTLYPFHYNPARWLCSGHAFEHSSMESIDHLIESEGAQFALQGASSNSQDWHIDLRQGEGIHQGALTDKHGWHIDLQQGTIFVSLKSKEHACKFTNFLRSTKRTFDLTIHFAWEPSRPEIKFVLEHLTTCNIRILEIDASNLEFLHHSPMEYTRDLFVEHIEKAFMRPGLFVILHSYPQESQMYIYLGLSGPMVCGFLLDNTPKRYGLDWWKIQKELYKYNRTLRSAPLDAEGLSIKFAELSSIVDPLIRLGLQDVDVYSDVNGFWELRFGVQNGAVHGIVACTTPFLTVPITESVHHTLQRITIQYNLPESKQWLFHLMDSNPTIQQINIPAQEHDIYELIETIERRWHGGPNPLEVTIYEQGLERVGRKLAIVVMENAPRDPTFLRNSAKTNDTIVEIKKWECSYVSNALRDTDAKILKTMTEAHPTALKSFTLNISSLTEWGLASIQSVLRQSHLDHLHIKCTEIDTSKGIHLGLVLATVNWSTIKSLKLSGDSIDFWMKLWAENSNLHDLLPCEYQLLRMDIIGPEAPRQELSHTSAMWLHSLIYVLIPTEIHIENIVMKEIRDWELIQGAADGTMRESISLVNCTNAQTA